MGKYSVDSKEEVRAESIAAYNEPIQKEIDRLHELVKFHESMVIKFENAIEVEQKKLILTND